MCKSLLSDSPPLNTHIDCAFDEAGPSSLLTQRWLACCHRARLRMVGEAAVCHLVWIVIRWARHETLLIYRRTRRHGP